MADENQISVSPQQIASWLLEFLDTADCKGRAAARRMTLCEQFVTAIGQGSVKISSQAQAPGDPNAE